MLHNLYKLPLWKCSFLLVFLWLGCNQKPLQNADSKQVLPTAEVKKTTTTTTTKTDPNAKENDPFAALVLPGARSPTLIYGSNPGYLKMEKGENGWDCKFVEDASLDDPGLVDQSFPLNAKDGLQFHKDPKANDFGLYFAQLPVKTKINVCGTTECKQVNVPDVSMMVVRTTPKQFDELFTQAKLYDPREIPEKNWSLYFFDENLKTFQSAQAVKMSVTKETNPTTQFDWNTVLGQTGKTGLTEEHDKLQLKWLDLEKPIMVGKYKSDDGKNYRVIGITQFTFQENKSK